MSDFDKTETGYDVHHANASVEQREVKDHESIKVSNTGNFDDFERLDRESIREQHQRHDIEKELFEKGLSQQHYAGNTDFDVESTTTTHAANVDASGLMSTGSPQPSFTPATANLLDMSDDQFDTMQRDNSPSNFEAKSLHSSSTDRPLVTLPTDVVPGAHENYSFSSHLADYQAASGFPETTEVNLTPDPDDKLGLGLDEPFVNITGNLIGVEKLEHEPKLHPTGIYPGKLYAQGYAINPAESDEEEDEEIVEEEVEDIVEAKGPARFNLESEPDVVHPSAPDLISSPYQQHTQDVEEEEFSELAREDSPPPKYELPDDKSKFSTFIDKAQSQYRNLLDEEDVEEDKEQKLSSVTQISKETIVAHSERVKKETEFVEKESHQMTSVTSKIEELIEELTPPFAACPSAAPPSKIEMAKREEIFSTSAEKGCTFHPRAWFNPEKLDPRVADLIYWRDVKKSGICFGTGMVVLLCLTYFSLISVLAYLLLAVMSVTLSYRIYKNVLQAVQKSTEGHPFKQYLDVDLTLSRDKVNQAADAFIKHVECTVKSLRRLFLVEDLVDSLKFAVVLWCFTYIGSWFNGLTLVILAFVSLFTLPKVYETYKTQIDHYLHIACSQIDDVVNKVKAKIPIGKKPKQQ